MNSKPGRFKRELLQIILQNKMTSPQLHTQIAEDWRVRAGVTFKLKC